jgi:hypothetical protein
MCFLSTSDNSAGTMNIASTGTLTLAALAVCRKPTSGSLE